MVEKVKNSQKLRFLMVGAFATALDFGLLFMFRGLGLSTIMANYPATTIAMLASFFANRHYTFKASGAKLRRQMVLFFTVTLIALWIIQPIVIALVEPLVIRYTDYDAVAAFIAKLVATFASLTWNYLLYSRVVFPPEERD